MTYILVVAVLLLLIEKMAIVISCRVANSNSSDKDSENSNSNDNTIRKKKIRFAPNVKKMDGFQMREARYQAFVSLLTNQVYEDKLFGLSRLTRDYIIGFLRETIVGGVAAENYNLVDLLRQFRNGHTLPSIISRNNDISDLIAFIIGRNDFLNVFRDEIPSTVVSSSEESTPERRHLPRQQPRAHELNVTEADFAQFIQEVEGMPDDEGEGQQQQHASPPRVVPQDDD